MKNLKLLLLLSILFFATTLTAQVFQKAATDAFMITRMAEKFHIQPRNINSSFSNDVFTTLLNKLDDEKIFLTQDDMKQLENYRYIIHNDINNRKTNFIELLTSLYAQRLQQADTMLASIAKTKFNFTIAENFTVKEDTSFPANAMAMKTKLYKITKYATAASIAYFIKASHQTSTAKQVTDSLEPIYRARICNNFKRDIQKKLQYPGGLQQLVCNEYCVAISVCYDPHSEYFTLTERENFEGEIGKKNMVFGFNLKENEDGSVSIYNLLPGSPAFKSGMINKGDKITAIQWEGSKSIDVSNATVQEISEMLSASNHAKATITFTKADGTKREVTLSKELATNDEDDDKVTSYVLKGEKNIGYIALPSFYEDWENENSINGCSNDVAKEILKLKKENIEGLIIDLRFNGGGSVSEAIDLAGIFIDAGPIAQMKYREPKPFSLKDMNRGTIYDGPLTILVNGFSASASELVAGALQDYNRALIIGSTTYGKATGQRVLALDTNIVLKDFREESIRGNSLKLTLSQVYQVSGKTAQFRGVVPDILLPDATEAFNKKEKNEPFAIPSNNIEANKYYLALKPLPINTLQEKANEYVKADNHFEEVKKYITQKQLAQQKKDVSLKLDDLVKQKNTDDEDDNTEDEQPKTPSLNKSYTVNNNSFELDRINANANFKTVNEAFKKRINKDSYVTIAYKLLLLMNK